MRKVARILIVVMLLLTGCVVFEESDVAEHTMEFVESKDVVIDEREYVVLFFDYTNNSGETMMPCDGIDVKAFQNGVELVVTVFTGDKMDGAVQCDTNIQDGTTARIVWLFERVDESPVSVEMSDGQSFVVGDAK